MIRKDYLTAKKCFDLAIPSQLFPDFMSRKSDELSLIIIP